MEICVRVLLASIENKCSLPSHSATLSSTLKSKLKMYVMYGVGGRAKIYLYLNTNFIHQRSRLSAYTLTGRVNKPLDMY